MEIDLDCIPRHDIDWCLGTCRVMWLVAFGFRIKALRLLCVPHSQLWKTCRNVSQKWCEWQCQTD